MKHEEKPLSVRFACEFVLAVPNPLLCVCFNFRKWYITACNMLLPENKNQSFSTLQNLIVLFDRDFPLNNYLYKKEMEQWADRKLSYI